MMRARTVLVLMMLVLSGGATFVLSTTDSAHLETADSAAVSARTANSADVPEWRVGDRWIYAGSFDPQGLISQGGVNANVGIITGDSTNTVSQILTLTIENQSTLVYKVQVWAEFDKSGVNLDGYNGDLEIDYSATEFWRASDLALIQRDLDLAVDFDAFGFVHIDVADVTISTSYAPPQEGYDFPLREGERWIVNTTSGVVWGGSSDYINPLPEDTSEAGTDYFEVTDFGTPINPQGQGISYTGCSSSFEVTSYDDNGLVDGYNWYCPEARSYAWMHSEDSIGLTIDFRLKSYSPTDSTGVAPNSDSGLRNTIIDVELKNPLTALNATQEAWVNITDSTGAPLSGESVELRHEREGVALSGTTGANGSAWFSFNAGDAVDPSPTTYDWASHGIIAWQSAEGRLGAVSMTLDDNLVGLDLVAMLDRVSIVRNRSGEVRPLNEISGFNVLAGDNLTFELPVMNRGIDLSFPTTVEVSQPDGQIQSFPVPSLTTYEEYRVGFSWTVPEDATIGNVSFSYQVDPTLINADDAEPSNNFASLALFIGTLPEVIVDSFEPILSMKNLSFGATSSYDEDGGGISCSFNVEYEIEEELKWRTVEAPDCIANLSWVDDGEFEIIVSVTDEEQDTAQTSVNVTVLNRPATVIVSSQLSETPALSMITMEVFANDTDSEDDWPGLVDVYWPDANCLEGYFTRTCTTTSNVEGLQTFTAHGTDDDGQTTTADWNVMFTNAIPSDVSISLWDTLGQGLSADQQGTYHVLEDDVFWLHADATDSADDLSDLEWRWRPDDTNSSWFERTEGDSSAIEVAWTRSGRNVILLEVVDDDGASSGFIETWVQVDNVPPTIDPLPSSLPIAEAQTVQLTGEFHDTASDNATIIACWDVDAGINQDGVGSADDDCDVFGSTLTWSWPQSGVYQVIFHVTDNDGARSYKTTNITVVNQPPRPTISACDSARAGSACKLEVTGILDSPEDLPYLTYTWDIDADIDSDGDGIANNDGDLIGKEVEQIWSNSGSFEVTIRVLDEDVSRAGTTTIIVEVGSSQGGFVGDVIAGVLGEQASPIIKVLAIILVGLVGIVGFRAYHKPKDYDATESAPWDVAQQEKAAEETMQIHDLNPTSEQVAPMVDLSAYPHNSGILGEQSIMESHEMIESESPPLPSTGLPDGWTSEQWRYYGKNWLENHAQTAADSDSSDLDL